MKRLAVLVLVAVVLAGLWLGGAIRDMEYRQSVTAAHSAPQLTAEQILSANALNKRAQREDRLPDLLSSKP